MIDRFLVQSEAECLREGARASGGSLRSHMKKLASGLMLTLCRTDPPSKRNEALPHPRRCVFPAAHAVKHGDVSGRG